MSQHAGSSDEAEFTAFATREYQSAMRAAYHIVRSRDLAQEIVQDALLEFWNRRATLNPSASPGGLLITIVRRRAIDVWRGQRAEAQREAATVVQDLAIHNAVESEQAILSDVTFETVIATLPDRVALAIRLRYLDQLSFSEIGAIMGISDKAAQQFVLRGIRQLRTKLAP